MKQLLNSEGVRKVIDLRRMCDKCLRIVGEQEDLVGFKIVDDLDNERVFKGHTHCVEEMGEVIVQLYGKKSEE